jgi:hypothetical protein
MMAKTGVACFRCRHDVDIHDDHGRCTVVGENEECCGCGW